MSEFESKSEQRSACSPNSLLIASVSQFKDKNKFRRLLSNQIEFICTTINIVSAQSHTFTCTKTYYIVILQIHGYIT